MEETKSKASASIEEIQFRLSTIKDHSRLILELCNVLYAPYEDNSVRQLTDINDFQTYTREELIDIAYILESSIYKLKMFVGDTKFSQPPAPQSGKAITSR